MMKLSISILFILFTLSACSEHNKRLTASNPDILSMEHVLTDTTKTAEVHFPVYFDSTRVLIQLIGFIDNEDTRYKISPGSLSKSNHKEDMSLYASMSNDIISGNITNIFFDDVDTGTSHLLTDKVLNIKTIEYLRHLSKEIGINYLLYTVYDQGQNSNGKPNETGIPACYISLLNGTAFEKITPDNQYYIPGVWALWCQRYYFNTIEDINQDGKLDKKDLTHYYYINFTTVPYEVIEYNPVKKKVE